MVVMPIPLPRPASVVGLTRSAVDQAVGSAASLAALPARAFGVFDRIEALVDRVGALLDRVEQTLVRTDRVVAEAEEAVSEVVVISAAATAAIENATAVAAAAATVVGDAERVAAGAAAIVGDAEDIVGRTGRTVARAESISATADDLLSAYETTLRAGAPMAHRFVDQLTPEEIDAAIRLVDELPKLTEHLTSDVLPILAKLDRVGPDIHDLLEVTRDLKLAVAGIPGLTMLRRRGERLIDEDDPLPK
jgi:ABC-type transporter Mla subunit MlaD